MPSKVDYFYLEGGEEGEEAQQDQPKEKKAKAGIKDKYGPAASEFNLKDNSKIETGLVEDRHCTDILCLGVFFAFVIAMIVAVVYCLAHGNIGKALAPYDKDGNICGYTKGYEDYPVIYFEHPSGDPEEIFDSGLCSKECPKEKDQTVTYKSELYSEDKEQTLKAPYKTYDLFNFCLFHTDDLPTNARLEWAAAKQALLASSGFMNDLYMSSRAVFWSMGLSFLYCVIFIYLMSFFAEYISWAIVILCQLGFIGASVFGFMQFVKGGEENESEHNKRTMWLFVGIIFGVLAMIFACGIYCGFQSLKVAIDIIDASADFLAGTKRIILVPLLYFGLTMIVVVFWLFAMLSAASMGEITAETSSMDPLQKDFELSKSEEKMFVIMSLVLFFGLLWMYNLFKAKTSFIVMTAASTYYFDSNKDKEGSANVSLGFKNAYYYHMGSLALGSFIIALIQFIRIVVVSMAKQAANSAGNNAAAQAAIKCAECILKCIEKICDYINKTAYAYMAISGDSFCTSAWNGFLLNVKHALKFSWANFLAGVFIALGKISIIVINCGSLYLIMKYITKDIEEGVDLKAPMIVVAFATFMTASLFLGLFDEAVIALLHCLCVDTDLNGSPMYGPPTFHDSLGKFGEDEDTDDFKKDGPNEMA